MSDIERVKEMVSEGRITADEGDQLIKVLQEVDFENQAAVDAAYEAAVEAGDLDTDAAESSETANDSHGGASGAGQVGADGSAKQGAFGADAVDAATELARQAGRLAQDAARVVAHQGAKEAREALRYARDAARESARSAREAAREAARSAREAATGPNSGASEWRAGAPEAGEANARPGAGIAPVGTKWVTVEMIAGDLDVWAVEGLTGPEVEGGPGNINVEDGPDGYTVKFSPLRGNPLDRLLSHVRSGNLTVRIPADHGLVVRATAGDVELHGVRYLRGKLTAGNLEAESLEGIDFSSMAGDLNVGLLLRGGRHALTVGAGDVEVRLDERSDVTVAAVVSIGDARSTHGAFSHTSRTVGARLNGALGSGAAQLDLRATTGDIAVTVGRAQGRSETAPEEDDRV